MKPLPPIIHQPHTTETTKEPYQHTPPYPVPTPNENSENDAPKKDC